MGGETARDALTATVVNLLQQHARHSVHPADQAALQNAAARMALALQAQFVITSRHSSSAEQTERQQVSERTYE